MLIQLRRSALVVVHDPTERKRAEAALGQSERRNAAVLDSVLDSIITMDAHGMVIEFNAAAERTFGYSKAEAIGRALADLIIPPRLRKAHAAGLSRYLGTGEGPLIGKLIEITAVGADGAEIPVELTITVIRSDQGPIFIGVLRDITARKQADETRACLAAIVDSSDDAIFSSDLDDTILTWNAGAERVYGYTASEVIGQSRALIVPAGKSPELTAMVEKARRGEAGEPFEAQRTRKDGSIVDLSLTISPMMDPSGRVTGVSTIARDVTSRKRAEAELKRLNDEIQLQRHQEFNVAQRRAEELEHEILERKQAESDLRTAAERMRFALQNANVGIWDLDCRTGALEWSETLEAHYGLEPGTFGGTFEAFIERIHPEDREPVRGTFRRAMETGADFSTLNRSTWPDGTTRWLSGAGRIRLGDHGEPVRGVGISLDVTERRTLEAQYQQAQKMEAIGRLAGGVAHDFNNMLTAILGYSAMLTEQIGPDKPIGQDLREITAAAERAAALTKQLLAFSRSQVFSLVAVDVTQVVRTVKPMLQRLLGERITIATALADDLASVMADVAQLELLLINLSVNARDAMPEGGLLTFTTANVTLDATFTRDHPGAIVGPYVMVSVADTGIGMAPEVKARIFEPFFTTKEVGRGTGLGLAALYGTVKQLGGYTRVESHLGRGTTFSLYLPKAIHTARAERAPESVSTHVGSETILLVEDESGVRAFVKIALQRFGYRVIEADTAEAALTLLKGYAGPVHLLLTDIVLPVMDGTQLAAAFTRDRPDSRVLFMSGYASSLESIARGLDPSVQLLEKPFTAQALLTKTRQLLEVHA
jgi:PAS domain S-box-containing protein